MRVADAAGHGVVDTSVDNLATQPLRRPALTDFHAASVEDELVDIGVGPCVHWQHLAAFAPLPVMAVSRELSDSKDTAASKAVLPSIPNPAMLPAIATPPIPAMAEPADRADCATLCRLCFVLSRAAVICPCPCTPSLTVSSATVTVCPLLL